MAISIDFLANVSKFIRGTSDVEQALDSVSDALDDVAADGSSLDADLSRSFAGVEQSAKGAADKVDAVPEALDTAAREGVRSNERLERSFRDLADTAKRETREVGQSAKKNIGAGSPASEATSEFKNEAISNFSEVASSFTGDITQMADGVQGLTGGLASALTPGIGIPIAILGAAAGAFLANWTTASEKSSEQVGEMFDDMIESGQNFLSEGFIQQAIGDIAKDTGKWQEALDAANETGVSIQTVLRATAGDQESINAVVDATNEKRDTELEKLKSLGTDTQDYADKVDAVNLKADTTIEKWNGISSATDTAAAKAAAVRGAFESGNSVLDDGIRKVQDLSARLDTLGTGKSIRLDVIPDMSEFERVIGLQQGRTITVNVDGQITRIGNQVW